VSKQPTDPANDPRPLSTLTLRHWSLRLRWLYRNARTRLLHIDRQRIVIRPLEEREVPVLDRKGEASIDHSYAVEWQAQCAGEVTMLVAWYGRRPMALGFVHWAGPRQPAVQAIYPGCPEIFRLHVKRNYRSMGLGTLLIEAFERLARERGHPCIGLGVTYANPKALMLYQRLGYDEPAPSDFMDEFDLLDTSGRLTHHAQQAHFLVKQL
jgi:GNAT superfamily N-acetyltransferase